MCAVADSHVVTCATGASRVRGNCSVTIVLLFTGLMPCCLRAEPAERGISVEDLTAFHQMLMAGCDKAGIKLNYDGPLGRSNSVRDRTIVEYEPESLRRWSLSQSPVGEQPRVLAKIMLNSDRAGTVVTTVKLHKRTYYINVLESADLLRPDELLPVAIDSKRLTLRQFLEQLEAPAIKK